MTTTSPNPSGTDDRDTSLWQLPRRSTDNRVIGGVGSGIARELGVDPIVVRVSFVVLLAAGGWGALLYGAAWALMTLDEWRHPERVHHPVEKGSGPGARLAGVLFIVSGLLLFVYRMGGISLSVVVPAGVLALGLLLAWRRVGGPDGLANGHLVDRRLRMGQVVAGLLLAAGGVTWWFVANVDLDASSNGVLAAVAVSAGMAILSAPWWLSLVNELGEERRRRIRSEEKAEVAAHLHDSVLQTLSLIQRNADDPLTMVNLARRQERELRNWLDPDRASRSGGSVRGELDRIATEVEELHRVPVEVVVVGDHLVDEPTQTALAAVREAAVNAARHSGADRVDVFAEVTAHRLDIFVRDTGDGFDPDAIPPDRRGVRESIEGRLARAGGTAIVTSAPGEGTEVELSIPLRPEEPAP
ncbi:MAG: PspC domain-containing protein [Actinomycetia bacterium]|nr:PspC domain-containing protein [Actinomycetes bacterium]